MNKVVIVNKDNKIISAEEISDAIQKELIRRVVRVFLINDKDGIYLQRRAPHVLLFPDRWDQSVGGHVDEGEDDHEAAKREMHEELGIDVPLQEAGRFYCEERWNGKLLKEWNTVYCARGNGEGIKLSHDEISRGKWFRREEINTLIKNTPEEFAEGFIKTWDYFDGNVCKDA